MLVLLDSTWKDTGSVKRMERSFLFLLLLCFVVLLLLLLLFCEKEENI